MRRRGARNSDDRRLDAAHERIRELERTVSALAAGLDDLEADLERIGSSRAWRWGHALTLLGWRLTGRRVRTQGAVVRALERVQRIRSANPGLPVRAPRSADGAAAAEPPPTTPEFDPETVAGAEGPRRTQLALDIRAQLGSVPARGAWPPVSVIILTRDGHERLRRALAGLAEVTDYPALETIVVDNGSQHPIAPLTDESGLRTGARTIRNEQGATFSEANNAAAAQARGDVLLFMNDDVEPFEAGWLKELIAAVLEDGVGAAAATLLHVAHGRSLSTSGWIVQHRGVRFRLEDQLPRAFNDGDRDDLFDEQFGRTVPYPAVSAACVAVRREAFEQAGGFSTGYRFGTEDVDLCLTLRDAGWEIRGCGRAVAFHRESSTQALTPRLEITENRRANRRLFIERWGARLRRELRRDRLAGDRYWTLDDPRIGLTLTSLDEADGWGDWYTAHELGDALEARGVSVSYVPRRRAERHPPPGDLDVLVALMDTFDPHAVHPATTVVGWVRNWAHRWAERPWFPRIELFLTSSAGSAAVLEEEAGMASVRFPLATNPARFCASGEEPIYDYVLSANRWGVEREIEPGLEPRPGERFAVFGDGWEEVPEVAEHWRGPVRYDRLPGVYARTRIVLDDTAGPTLPYGALNARVFDALACGALVLTNCVAGARELFDDAFPVWSQPAEVREALDRLLADEPRRRALGERYRATVLAEHTYERRAEQLVEVLSEAVERLSFVIRIGAPDWERAERWGDLHYARALAQELTRRGHRCLIQVLEEWDQLEGCCYDVAIVLRGRSRHRPKAGQLGVLWLVSHPDEVTVAECDDHDLVAVASERYARELAGRTETPVFTLEQATDPWRFRPDPDPDLAHEIVFVGNSRGVRRQALEWLLPTNHDVAIWGGDWDGLIDPAYVAGEYVPNEQLCRVYSSAKIVLADHWPDMRELGFISNRIYDALASGAMVVSDSVEGLDRFGGCVATYRTAAELREQVDHLLADDEQRRARAERGRDAVLAQHTFAHRVNELLARVHARRAELGHRDGILARSGS